MGLTAPARGFSKEAIGQAGCAGSRRGTGKSRDRKIFSYDRKKWARVGAISSRAANHRFADM